MDDRRKLNIAITEALSRKITAGVKSRLVTLVLKSKHKSNISRMLQIAADQLGRELDAELSKIDRIFERAREQRYGILGPDKMHDAAMALAKEKPIDFAEAVKLIRQEAVIALAKQQNIDFSEAEKQIRQHRPRKESSKSEKKFQKVMSKYVRERAFIVMQRAEVKMLQEVWITKEIEYECPKCDTIIKRKLVSSLSHSAIRVRLMKYHWREFHKMDWKRASEWMDNHRHKTDSTNYVSELLSFEILPPGEWTLERTIQQYRRNENAIVEKWGCSIDYSRIREIYKLEPDQRYWGTEGFLGYSIYEFSRFEKVVLDCPIEGNAVYLLYKDRWKNQSGLTKKEIRDNLRGEYRKIVHKGQWIDRVLDELKRGSFM